MAIVLLFMSIVRHRSHFHRSLFRCVRRRNGDHWALLLLSCLLPRGGRWACLVALVIAMEVAGLVSSRHDLLSQWRLLGLSHLVSLILSSQGRSSGSTRCIRHRKEGLYACLVGFVVPRRSSGLSHCVRHREEVVVLFIVIVKRCCLPRRLDVAVVVISLLSL